MKLSKDGLVLKEINPLFSLEDVINATDAELIIPDNLVQKAV